MIKHLLGVVCMLCIFINKPSYIKAQTDLNKQKLNTFFVDGMTFVSIVRKNVISIPDNATIVSSEIGGGVQFKAGNNWYLQRGKFNGILRLTWVRLGVYHYGFIASPLHLGLGHHFKINDKFSIEPMVSGGAVVVTDDMLNPGWVINYGILPEIKFNINRFVIGVEYSFRNLSKSASHSQQRRLHYVALSFGFRLGKF